MLETLGALRSSDMFDIVIDYPDSAPALQDLAVCLQHTSLAGHFAASFRAALQQRLLHAGAATSDIIHTYISTIRAMQQVDPSGERLCCVHEAMLPKLGHVCSCVSKHVTKKGCGLCLGPQVHT
jgi:anaphase-promoting complex subunit 2